ncbi:type II toxin-antitoxin system RelE/ParE family toxin [Belliella sp. DSM 107340]|uniref:Type II toxin-antitoxin system RelE/ParE family toxin n=1 Tax=Belliella calami TaxID=2923436 RepID=A0ABS9URS2_9BACT|nr:type II toxin-antitoxin system RelE/ParE family toxin [Belliella calami]
MKRKVVFSSRAKTRLSDLLDYLEFKWSSKVKQDFINKLDHSVNRIVDFPNSCPESKEIKGLFKCVVTKQTSIYYRINEDEIEIIMLFDNRENPNKIHRIQ